MSKIVCAKCGLFFRPKKNGVVVEEGRPMNTGRDSVWLPYKLWAADSLVCHGCGTEIIAGFGLGPLAEHYQANYETLREECSPVIFVKDCA